MIESVTISIIFSAVPAGVREQCRRWWVASCKLLKSIPSYRKRNVGGGITGRLLGDWNIIQHRFWLIVTAADIPLNCQIEGGLLLSQPNDVVIGLGASIEPNFLIFQ